LFGFAYEKNDVTLLLLRARKMHEKWEPPSSLEVVWATGLLSNEMQNLVSHGSGTRAVANDQMAVIVPLLLRNLFAQ
jgi:hypothetical protein